MTCTSEIFIEQASLGLVISNSNMVVVNDWRDTGATRNTLIDKLIE